MVIRSRLSFLNSSRAKYFSRFLCFLLIIYFHFVPTELLPMVIKLENGAYVTGEIITVNNNIVYIKSWHNGGTIQLTWRSISSDCTDQIRRALELTSNANYDLSDDIDASRVYLRNGAIYTGILLEQITSEIRMKLRQSEEKIPMSGVLKMHPIKVSPMQVYTPLEWYDIKSKIFNTAKASDNFRLAEYCAGYLKLYEKAIEHYNMAAQLSAIFKDESEKKINQINLINIQEKIDEINKLMYAKDFKAIEESKKILLDLIKLEVKDSILAEKIKALNLKVREIESNTASKIEQEQNKKVYLQFSANIKLLIRKICSQNMSYADTMAYIQTMLVKQAINKLAKDMNMTEESVSSIVKEKLPLILDSLPEKEASYGDGSWIVNEDNYLAASSMNPEEFAKYQKKLKDVQDAKNKAAEKNELITADTWWKSADSTQKEKFIEAAVAQRYMNLVAKKQKLCPLCNGEGIVTKNLCKKCWGTLVELVIIYK